MRARIEIDVAPGFELMTDQSLISCKVVIFVNVPKVVSMTESKHSAAIDRDEDKRKDEGQWEGRNE